MTQRDPVAVFGSNARRPLRLAAIALALAGCLGGLAAGQSEAPATPAATSAPTSRRVTPSGLTIIDLGRVDLEVQPGDLVTCHYVGTLADGLVFDSSRARNQPFTFRLGETGVIKGWAEGIVGMRVGDKRRLIIPPELGYGERGAMPKIPPAATLTFDLEVLAINRPQPPSDQPPPMMD